MGILLVDHGIIGDEFGSHNTLKLGINQIGVFAKQFHGLIHVFVAFQVEAVMILQIDAVIVPIRNFYIGVHLLHVHDAKFSGQTVEGRKSGFHNPVLVGEGDLAVYIGHGCFGETTDDGFGMEQIRVKLDGREQANQYEQRNQDTQLFHIYL